MRCFQVHTFHGLITSWYISPWLYLLKISPYFSELFRPPWPPGVRFGVCMVAYALGGAPWLPVYHSDSFKIEWGVVNSYSFLYNNRVNQSRLLVWETLAYKLSKNPSCYLTFFLQPVSISLPPHPSRLRTDVSNEYKVIKSIGLHYRTF